MVKIRLRRMGAKKRPFYRIVVADSRTPRDGRFIEMVGTYDPNSDPPTINLKRERIEHWLANGALPTDTTRGLLKSQGFLGGKPVEEKPESKKRTKATKKAEAAAETAAEAPAEPAAEASAEPAAE